MKPIKIALAIMIPLIVILFGFRIYVFNMDFYQQEFEKYGIHSSFPEADFALTNLMKYLEEDTDLSEKLFTEREILHLQDVKTLIWSGLFLLNFLFITAIILILILFARKDYHALSQSFFFGGIASLGFTLLLLILSLFVFPKMFTTFHEIFFTNNLWQLSGSTSLIRMFPLPFFYDLARGIFLNSILLSVFMIFLGYGAKFIKEK